MGFKSEIDDFRLVFYLAAAVFSREKGDLASARQRLDKALAFGEQVYCHSLALAFDGVLKVQEDDWDAAHARFLECSTRTNSDEFLHNEYAAAYRRLFLKLLDLDCSFDEVKDAQLAAAAAQVGTTRFARRALPLKSMDELEKLYSVRATETKGAWVKGQLGSALPADTRVTSSVMFDF
ncbi:hypothetical protein GRI89_15695 [Altererythrobacter salegens]|uniref:Uncharacterized protein n=1 Tax=Croceibacterium salegens TaxID=1737568 RepID=A0A6I4SY72_9SPHN|nr:hypothetical protein [Croceibacterium salegens]MXO60985.1 hypothetical protein [Croceibacterium salegens]